MNPPNRFIFSFLPSNDNDDDSRFETKKKGEKTSANWRRPEQKWSYSWLLSSNCAHVPSSSSNSNDRVNIVKCVGMHADHLVVG